MSSKDKKLDLYIGRPRAVEVGPEQPIITQATGRAVWLYGEEDPLYVDEDVFQALFTSVPDGLEAVVRPGEHIGRGMFTTGEFCLFCPVIQVTNIGGGDMLAVQVLLHQDLPIRHKTIADRVTTVPVTAYNYERFPITRYTIDDVGNIGRADIVERPPALQGTLPSDQEMLSALDAFTERYNYHDGASRLMDAGGEVPTGYAACMSMLFFMRSALEALISLNNEGPLVRMVGAVVNVAESEIETLSDDIAAAINEMGEDHLAVLKEIAARHVKEHGGRFNRPSAEATGKGRVN